MQVKAVCDAWRTILTSAPFNAPPYNFTTATVLEMQTPEPWTGDTPFVVILWRTISDDRFSGNFMQTTGTYRLLYFNTLAGDQTDIGTLLQQTSDFATLLRSVVGQNKNLNQPSVIAWVGEHWALDGTQVQVIHDQDNNEIYGFPIDVDVREMPQVG